MSEVALADCGTWLSGGTPNTAVSAYWGGDIPWITASSLTTRHLSTSTRRLTSLGLAAGSRIVPANTLIFVVRGMSLKNEFRVGLTTRDAAFGQDCKALVPREGIDPEYLLLAFEAARDRILRLVDEASHGTGRLQTPLLGALRVRIPPHQEQRRIAEIFDAIDDTIRATKRLIVKTGAARAGIVEALLSSAEGETVRLDSRAHVFGGKRLPAGWSYSTRPTASRYLRVLDFYRRPIDYGSLESLTSETLNILRRYEIAEGDCYISIAGSIGFVGVCKPPAGMRIILTENAARLVCDDTLDPEFLALQMNARAIQQQIDAEVGTGAGVPKLALHRIASLRLVVPPIEPQLQVVRAAQALDSKLASINSELGKLLALRAGLAADLLTGRVRVGVGEGG
jgi:type I restriction enzyme, S subunit